jgi:glutamine amidotransferase
VVKFPESSLPVPHVGWNNVEYRAESKIFKGMDESPDFYFVHSFYLNTPVGHPDVVGYSNYIVDFASAVECENIFGVQFHPEKSQKNGKTLLRNFASVR